MIPIGFEQIVFQLTRIYFILGQHKFLSVEELDVLSDRNRRQDWRIMQSAGSERLFTAFANRSINAREVDVLFKNTPLHILISGHRHLLHGLVEVRYGILATLCHGVRARAAALFDGFSSTISQATTTTELGEICNDIRDAGLFYRTAEQPIHHSSNIPGSGRLLTIYREKLDQLARARSSFRQAVIR